jgi:ABC-type antimicrobial peptide transport system permease subunit
MPERLRTTLARDRFNTVLMLLLGSVGLVLSAVGIYGVISCFVTQRRRELAIRVALGAHSRNLVLMVLNQGMRPVWVGIAIGVLAAVGASQALSAYIYGVTTRDPLTFTAVILLLVAAAVIANVFPARSAARVNPAELLVN